MSEPVKELDKRLKDFFQKIHTEPHSREFDSFPVFRSWAYKSGFAEDAVLLRLDPDKPFNRDNCYWEMPGRPDTTDTPDEREVPEKVMVEDYCYIVAKWDRFVDGVRQMLNLPPIMTADPCTGCPNARKCELFDTVCKTRMRWWDKRMKDIREQQRAREERK
jgi:hypothetical protein